MRIAILGFMGTGKSSTGRLLAERIGFEFIDTDNIIEMKEDCNISRIFSIHGEKYFRFIETQVLSEIIIKDNIVIATGGGIVMARENRELLINNTFPILLTASPDVIYNRILDGDRPLLNIKDPARKIKELLDKREEYYSFFKNRIITDSKSIIEVADEMIKLIGDDIIEKGS
jgi:shikimate kinase